MRRSLRATVRSLWRNLVRRRETEAQLTAELASYVELLVAEKIAAGMAPERARRAALVEVGGVSQVADEVRDVRAGRALDDLWRDLVAAGRSLTRGRWTVPLVAITTLALGIAANVALFSTVYGVLLRPLDLPQSDQLLLVNTRYTPESGYDFPYSSMSTPEYLDYRAQARTVTDVAAMSMDRMNLAPVGGTPVRVSGVRATANLLSVLGVEPRVGRGFREGDDAPGAPCVLVLSDGLWRDEFAGAPVVGRDVPLEGRPCRVSGVMPPGFAFPSRETRLWTPLALDPTDAPVKRASHWLFGVARRRPGVGAEGVAAELDVLRLRWEREHPEHQKGHFAVTRPLLEALIGSSRTTLLVLFAAVGLVLIGVCINLVGVNLARSESRRRETAVRLALGGRRRDVVRQLVFESLLLALLGGAAGWAGAHWLRGVLVRLLAGSIPRTEAIALDGRALGFTLAVTVLVGLALGWLSAAGAARVQTGEALHASARAVGGNRRALRARRAIVAVQVGLGLALGLTATWLIRSYVALARVDTGFDRSQVTTFSLSFPEATFPTSADVGRVAERLAERLRVAPGVAAAGLVSDLPLESSGANDDFEVEGRPWVSSGTTGNNAGYVEVTPGFFAALRIPLLRGRLLSDADREGAPLAAVINQTAARRFFADRDPLGQRIRWLSPGDPWVTIVGVVGDVRSGPLSVAPSPAVYAPYAQPTRNTLFLNRTMVATIRAEGSGRPMDAALRAIVGEVAPGVPISRWRTMADVVDAALGPAEVNMTLMSGFAAVVLALAGLGIYGLMAHSIAMREREIGLRIALGARRSAVWAGVVRQAVLISLVGIGVGIVVALGASPLLAKLTYGIETTDPVTIGLATLAVLAVAVLAAAVPAARAARVEPMAVLKLD
jgi:predicted permease